MTCFAAQDPEPMMTESLISLLTHGARMQAQQLQRSPRPQNVPQHQRQETSEERRLRIRGVLSNALKITADILNDDGEEEFQSALQDFAGGDRQ